jgi:hypothetical protein
MFNVGDGLVSGGVRVGNSFDNDAYPLSFFLSVFGG